MKEIKVPTLGESVTEATVATWFKKVGEIVKIDEMICELETDKVTIEIPSITSGRLTDIRSPEGTTVGINEILAVIDEKDYEDLGKANKKFTNDKIEENLTNIDRSYVEESPSAKKLMRENDLKNEQIIGSGKDGRIMKEDVIKVLKEESEIQKSPYPDTQNEERIKMSRMRQTIATRLKTAQNTAAMLTTYNEVDMTEIINIRNKFKIEFEKKYKIKLGFMSFFIKACCHALLEIPEVNSEIDNDYIIYKNYVNMSVAIGTPSGLVAPVIKNAHKLDFFEIEKQLYDFSILAREGNLKISDMKDGTFTISNGGIYGSLMSSPILNPPQSGILGMHKIQNRPVAINNEIKIRPMMYLALSYDHRIVDGKGAVTFLIRVKENLEEPNRILINL